MRVLAVTLLAAAAVASLASPAAAAAALGVATAAEARQFVDAGWHAPDLDSFDRRQESRWDEHPVAVEVAQDRADRMTDYGLWQHTRHRQGDLLDVASRTSELLARGDPDRAVDAWRDSPPHAAVLDGDWSHYGVGEAVDGQGRTVTVLVLLGDVDCGRTARYRNPATGVTWIVVDGGELQDRLEARGWERIC